MKVMSEQILALLSDDGYERVGKMNSGATNSIRFLMK